MPVLLVNINQFAGQICPANPGVEFNLFPESRLISFCGRDYGRSGAVAADRHDGRAAMTPPLPSPPSLASVRLPAVQRVARDG
jgi:hypothetical protein